MLKHAIQLFFLFSQDGEVRRTFQRSLEKQGLKFKLGTKVGTQVTFIRYQFMNGTKVELKP